MTNTDQEFPTREEWPSGSDEFSVPEEEAEFRPPDARDEFSPPQQSDYSPPDPDMEFDPPGRSHGAVPKRQRKKTFRRLLCAVAALVLLWFAIGGSPRVSPVPTPAETPQPAVTPEPEPPAEPSVTPAETPLPQTSEQTDELVCDLVFFQFSSSHEGFVKLINQEQVLAATVELWEKNLDTLEWRADMTAEEISNGYYRLPPFDESETYFNHLDSYRDGDLYPELEMRVTLTLGDGSGGAETLNYAASPSAEQGWGVSYWPDDYVPLWDGQEYYPGCFAVMSYESAEAPPKLRMGDYQDAVNSGEICVSLSIDGKEVPASGSRVVTRAELIYRYGESGDLEESGEVLYYTTLIIPHPADAPASGTAHFTVCQKLSGYDLVWVTERDLEYGS